MATFTGSDKAIGFLFDMVSNIADDYDSTATYSVNDYAIYEGVLYKCTSAITTAETFTPAHWQSVLVMDEVAAGGGGGSSTLSGLTDVSISSPTDGQALVYDGTLSKWKNGAASGGGGGNTGISVYTLDDIIDSWGSNYGQVPYYQVRQYRSAIPALVIIGNVCFLRLAWALTASSSSAGSTIMTLKQSITDLLLQSNNFLYSSGTFKAGSFLFANKFAPQNASLDFSSYTQTPVRHRIWISTQHTTKLRIDDSDGSSGQNTLYELTAIFTLPVSASGLAHEYSTTEQIVGKWIDGTTVYEKTIQFQTPVQFSTGWMNCGSGLMPVGGGAISCIAIDTNMQIHPCGCSLDTNLLLYIPQSNIGNFSNRYIKYAIIRYTKPTA